MDGDIYWMMKKQFICFLDYLAIHINCTKPYSPKVLELRHKHNQLSPIYKEQRINWKIEVKRKFVLPWLQLLYKCHKKALENCVEAFTPNHANCLMAKKLHVALYPSAYTYPWSTQQAPLNVRACHSSLSLKVYFWVPMRTYSLVMLRSSFTSSNSLQNMTTAKAIVYKIVRNTWKFSMTLCGGFIDHFQVIIRQWHVECQPKGWPQSFASQACCNRGYINPLFNAKGRIKINKSCLLLTNILKLQVH